MIQASVPAATPFLKGLACLSLGLEGLKSAVVFEAPPLMMHSAATQLANMVAIAARQPVEIVTLQTTETEESLWGTLSVGSQLEAQRGDPALSAVRQGSGRLTQLAEHPQPRIIVIPDLARSELPVMRAAVALMGSPFATLQRNGQSLIWQPNLWWIAGCSYAEVGEVSPHLLDRFSLRLTAPSQISIDRVDGVHRWAMGETERHQSAYRDATMPALLQQQLGAGRSSLPKFPSHLIALIVSLLEDSSSGSQLSGSRRPIALARLSRALAQLENAAEVRQSHIKQAVDLLGISTASDNLISQGTAQSLKSSGADDERSASTEETPPETDTPADKGEGITESSEAEPLPLSQISHLEGKNSRDLETAAEPVMQPNEEIVLTGSAILTTPYPEDSAPTTRCADSLKLPPKRYQSARARDGTIIGTQKAVQLRDIAFVSTVLEAAKFQKIRASAEENRTQFQVRRSDLRSYRRSPTPQQMLVVLLDYTCLKERAWEDAILPHLSWAYTTRASVSIIKVGALDARDYLRAEQVAERSLLSHRVSAAFESVAGSATPLAHGLDLAMRTLQAALQRGRGRTQEARFIVISDGRGNVPLAASQAGELNQPVSREGIEDALNVASKIRTIRHVDIFLLNPQPKQYSDLPIMLAEALGAVAEPIFILSKEEVEA